MDKLINRIGALRFWLIPIISVLVGEMLVLALLGFWAVDPWYRLSGHPGYRELIQAFVSLAFLMATAVFIATLGLNSWPWLTRCPIRRYIAQAVVGVGFLGMVGYIYSDLFWNALGESLLLLEHGRGIQLWAGMYLLVLNFAFVFLPYSVRFMATGASQQRGYLEYLLAKNEVDQEERLSLKEDVAYMYSQGEVRQVFTVVASRAPLAISQSLKELEQLVDPTEFFPVNRNYLVHWRAITSWEDEENGRRVKVWLNPSVRQPGRNGPEGAFEYISKEKADRFRTWYAARQTRDDSARDAG